MRHLKYGLLAGAALFALASTAAADDLTRDFTGVASGSVKYTLGLNAGAALGPMASFSEQGAVPINQVLLRSSTSGNNGGGSVEALVELGSNVVTFKSGTATVGPNSVTNSQSGIDILFSNTSESAIALSPFGSTITPAGMGFFVQDRLGLAIDGNPFTGYGQSETIHFSDFLGVVGAGNTFAHAEFDFVVMTGATVLYTLSGFVNLSFNADGVFVVDENLTGPGEAGQILKDFFTLNNHHALVYDWQATNIVIPLSGVLNGMSEQVVSYRANVTSWTRAPCITINNIDNCIVAFSGFGDPVGRGGGVEEEFAAAFGDVGSFDVDGGGDHDFVIKRLKFELVEVNVFHAVPEPSTWALMIGGFGLAGAALRRRRRVAYT